MNRTFHILLFCLLTAFEFAFSLADKQAFYKALSSGDEPVIDKYLASLDKEKKTSRITAYKGALIMKKAGFVKGVKGKVKTFKAGAMLLEGEIESNPANVEYRFLRLTVQEHAPNLLKYNKQLDEDKQAVIAGYNKLDSDLKSIISDYSKDSKVLKSADLK